MTIPVSTNRLHKDPYWLGDSPRAINIAAARLPGKRYIDQNFQATADGVVGVHWGTARENGYRFIQVGRKRRPMTNRELNRPIGAWKTADVLKWRRTRRLGTTYASRVRPYTFEELVRYAKRRGVIICPELKSRAFATNPNYAKMMKAAVVRQKATVYPMTLVTMWGWGQKMKNFHDVGFETALLSHGAPKPKDLAQWSPYISRVWGRWR